MTVKQLCRLLRKLLYESNVSLSEVERRCGVAHSTLVSWMSGVHSPRFETVCMVLNCIGYDIKVVKKE